jgi:hypothetical protein
VDGATDGDGVTLVVGGWQGQHRAGTVVAVVANPLILARGRVDDGRAQLAVEAKAEGVGF